MSAYYQRAAVKALASIARLNCRVAGMQAENQFYVSQGQLPVHGESAFLAALAAHDEDMGPDAMAMLCARPQGNPAGRPRPLKFDAAQRKLVRAHAAAGGTWKTFKAFDIKQQSYYNIVAYRGRYAAAPTP